MAASIDASGCVLGVSGELSNVRSEKQEASVDLLVRVPSSDPIEPLCGVRIEIASGAYANGAPSVRGAASMSYAAVAPPGERRGSSFRGWVLSRRRRRGRGYVYSPLTHYAVQEPLQFSV